MPLHIKSSRMPAAELLEKYSAKKTSIEKRLMEFRQIMRNCSDEQIYAEMAFCMLTPQSNARRCWEAIEELQAKKLLMSDDKAKIASVLRDKTRFHNNKAKYIAENKKLLTADSNLAIKEKLFSFPSPIDMRLWLVKNIKGYGWKEASHFMRNIGMGEDIAILDRHILKNLAKYGVISGIPKTLTPKKYAEIEEKMRNFCSKRKIPMAHLDLLFWSEETGEIFK